MACIINSECQLTYTINLFTAAIVNYDSSIITELGASLTDDARVIIYNRHMFIVHATKLFPNQTDVVLVKTVKNINIIGGDFKCRFTTENCKKYI